VLRRSDIVYSFEPDEADQAIAAWLSTAYVASWPSPLL
jgi:hypothetical protein